MIMKVRRKAIVRRKTGEVDITVVVDLDGGSCDVNTGIPFFDHMLKTFANYSSVGMKVHARGDDVHHTIEDTAIAMGEAIRRALGDKRGIARFGDAIVPMDDALAVCAVDVSGRGYFEFEGKVEDSGIKFEDFVHFFDTLCRNAGLNVHVSVKGFNSHHMMEACFKSFGLAFGKAIKIVGKSVRSLKGQLD